MSIARPRGAIVALSAGLVCTVGASVAPYLDRYGEHGLGGHIRAGYPTYSPARVHTAVNLYLGYLTGVAVVAALGWLLAIWAVRRGQAWTFRVSLGLFVLALAVALFDLLVKDTSGDTGLPPALGWVGLVPCAPGLIAVVLLRRRPAEVPEQPPS